MVDPNIVIGTGLGILGSKEILTKILGPTADYIGEEAKGLVEKCNINLNDIFFKAYKKLGKKSEEKGVVNPRVLKNIWEEGRFCEDDISKEYFAGVLASSKTKNSHDDRGVTISKLISTLSSYQLKTHYIFYSSLHSLFSPFGSVISPGTDRNTMMVYIPTESYCSAMDINSDFPNHNEKLNILSHCMNGLRRSNLIEDAYVFGPPDQFIKSGLQLRFLEFPLNVEKLSDHGIAFQPTPGGMELYLWVHGYGSHSHFQFLSNDIGIELIDNIVIPSDSIILYEDAVQHKKLSVSKDKI